jgi:hypothetical protein
LLSEQSTACPALIAQALIQTHRRRHLPMLIPTRCATGFAQTGVVPHNKIAWGVVQGMPVVVDTVIGIKTIKRLSRLQRDARFALGRSLTRRPTNVYVRADPQAALPVGASD